MMTINKSIVTFIFSLFVLNIFGQSFSLPYSNMNNWVTREIKESGIIGGKTRTLYEIGQIGRAHV